MRQIKLYTDGACSGNPGRGGWAAAAFNEANNAFLRNSGGVRLTTNNRMEILAVIEGLEGLYEELHDNRETDIKVTVYSDSQLVINTLNLGWAKKTNQDLWRDLEIILDKFHNTGIKVVFEKVRGHANDVNNILVDKMAVDASKSLKVAEDKYYESIAGAMNKATISDETNTVEISSIILRGENTPQKRKVEVCLSNGSCVDIVPCWGGFQQVNCTVNEASLTVDIANRFCKWLNGGAL